MKRIALAVCLVVLTICSAKAENLPIWTQKTEAWTVQYDQVYVFAVGVAAYSDTMPEAEFLKNFDLARENALAKLRSYCQVKELKGVQLINQEYNQPNMWLLLAVPKNIHSASNQSNQSMDELMSAQGFTKTIDAQGNITYTKTVPGKKVVSHESSEDSDVVKMDMENAMATAQVETLEQLPQDWWGLYKNGIMTFRYGDKLYAIGHGVRDPNIVNEGQAKAGARQAAVREAQKNFLTTTIAVITNYRGPGDWTVKVNGKLKYAQNAKVVPNPYFDEEEKDTIYILMCIPVETLKTIK